MQYVLFTVLTGAGAAMLCITGILYMVFSGVRHLQGPVKGGSTKLKGAPYAVGVLIGVTLLGFGLAGPEQSQEFVGYVGFAIGIVVVLMILGLILP